MSEREVRPARGDDIAAIEAIWHACLREGAWEGIGRADIAANVEALAARPERTIVAVEDGVVVGSLTQAENDLSVAPGSRRRGHGRALLSAAVERARARGEPYVLLYVPGGGDPPRATPARAFAEAVGMTYRATLTHMRRDRLAGVPEAAVPGDLVLRGLAPGEDLAAYVDLIRTSFADHPTHLAIDLTSVVRAHAAPGFEIEGIALLVPRDAPGRPIAFVRSQVEADDAGERYGDVGHLGVLPEWRGRGLGRALLRWALRRFDALGIDRAELSVVAANEAALRLYLDEGFTATVTWPQWTKDA